MLFTNFITLVAARSGGFQARKPGKEESMQTLSRNLMSAAIWFVVCVISMIFYSNANNVPDILISLSLGWAVYSLLKLAYKVYDFLKE